MLLPRLLTVSFAAIVCARAQQLPNACPLPDATAGEPYSHQMRATGFTAAPRWLPSGLPEGLTQNPDTGLITGTAVRAGSHLVTVFASAFQESQLAVAICNMTVNPPAASTLRILTAALPEAPALTPYTAALEADGGRSPYTWSPVSGSSLPAGLTLSSEGRVTGRAANPGEYSFRVRLSDTAGQQFETPIAMRVAPPPPFDINQTALSFTADTNGSQPPPSSVEVSSAVPHPFRATATTTDGAAWLSVTPQEGQTPATLAIQTSASGLAPGQYQGHVDIASTSGDAVRRVSVSLDVVSPDVAPKLTLDPTEFSIVIEPESPTTTRTLRVLNTGGGTLAFKAEARTLASAAWISVTPETGVATAAEPAVLTLRIDTTTLPRDTDTVTARVEVTTEDGQSRAVGVLLTVTRDPVPVTPLPSRVFLPLFSSAPSMPQSLSLRNDGREPVDFTVLSNIPNFVTQPARGTIAPGSVADLQLGTREAVAAQPGQISATLTVAFGPGKEPLRVPVGADIAALGATNAPLFSDNAVTLLPAAGADTAVQELRVQNPGSQAVTYQITPASTRDWLNIEPRRGTLEPGAIARFRVTGAVAGLPAGPQRGTLTFTAPGGVSRTIPVLLFVRGQCQSNEAVVQMRSLAGSPALNAAFPIAMEAGVYDNCGNPLRSGTVTLAFSNGDPAVALTSLLDGRWAGEWVVRNLPADRRIAWSLQVAAGNLRGVENGTVQLGQGSLPPAVLSVMDPVSGIEGRSLAPGSVFRITGARLADRAAQSALDSWPLSLSGAEVLLDGRPLPIFSTTPDGITAQAPYNLRTNQRLYLGVRRGGATSIPLIVNTEIAAPSIRTVDGSATGLSTFTDAEGKPINTENPARSGTAVTMFCTGLGRVAEAIEPGTVPANPLRLANPAFVRVAGQEARVTASALTVTTVGLYRVSFTVPQLPSGTTEANVIAGLGAQISQTVLLPVSVP